MNLENTQALLEHEVLTNLLHNKEYFTQVINHLDAKYFTEPGMKLMFGNVKKHYINFGSVPSLKEIVLSFKNNTKSDKELIKNAIPEIKEHSNVNVSLLINLTEEFIKDAIFTESIIMGAEALGSHNQQKKIESFKLAEESVKVSLNTDFGVELSDIDKVYDDFLEKQGLKIGIGSFDRMIGGGYVPKTLHTILAASGVGKSAVMCSFAVEMLRQHYDVVFITLEMSEAEVSKRIYCNLYDIDINKLSTIDKQVYKNKYNDIKNDIGTLNIKEFPNGSLTPLGLESYLENLKIEKNIKTPVVFVDYLGIMDSDKMSNKDNSYSFFGSIAEELRAVAQKNNLIIFTALQLNRTAVNNLEASQAELSESMKIFMTADSAFIVAQTPEMKEKGEMKINWVKNRMSGKTYSFNIGYDYTKFRFDDRFFLEGQNISNHLNTSDDIKQLTGLDDLMSF